MQAQQHNSCSSVTPWVKTADLMFLNMFSSIIALKKQVTSTLQAMKQWNLFNGFNRFLICFQPNLGWEEGRSLKRYPALFPQHFWLLVLIFFPHSCKIWGPYLVTVSSYWTWTKTIPEKNRFFWSNLYKISVMITSLIKMLN